MSGGVFTSPWLGTWGRPPDLVAWVALGVGIFLLLVAISPRIVLEVLGLGEGDDEQRRRIVTGTAFIAAFLSLGYVAYYLRGGPRIIDATSYFLEGRGIAHGKFSWPIPSPTASLRGRFLLFRDPQNLSVIFPPGYPLLLAGGFLVGAPLVVGPLLAGALVFATYWLAKELAHGTDHDAKAVGLLAAFFSLASAALRYHTADTMAHAASATLVTLGLASALKGKREATLLPFVLAGFALGGVMATRPVSAIPVAVAIFVLSAQGSGAKGLGLALLGMVPGVALLCVAQHAQTGHWLVSSQEAYYAVSDGPPGCFRYGFGKGTGCLYEHGDFVRAHLESGYGFVAALGTTARRLKAHLVDPLNFEPLILLVLWPLFGRLRSRAGLALAIVVGQVIAYAPFYFDGNYPGGGARFFADVLPLEHAIIALGLASLFPGVALVRKGSFVLGLAAAAFGVHTVFDHLALANRDDGRPMFEPDAAKDAQVTRGLLFFETDHGYNLAQVPGADPEKDIVAAHLYGDDHDRLLYEKLNHPQAHAYHVTSEGPNVVPWVPAGGSPDFWRFEAEAEWPPLLQSGGWAEPAWFSGTCASLDKAMTLHAGEGETASATLDVPVPQDGRWLVTPRIVRAQGHGRGTLKLVPIGRDAFPDDDQLTWEWNDAEAPTAPHPTCMELVPREVSLVGDGSPSGARWVMTAKGGSVTLDRTTLKLLH